VIGIAVGIDGADNVPFLFVLSRDKKGIV